jgi:hypothetical protein
LFGREPENQRSGDRLDQKVPVRDCKHGYSEHKSASAEIQEEVKTATVVAATSKFIQTATMKTQQKQNQPHVRLSADDILAQWKTGQFYKPTGYLFNLIKALRKDGWKLKSKVSEFCKRWEISERSFYRAKAYLVAHGIIEEAIHGEVELWIRESSVEDLTDRIGRGTARSGSETDRIGSETDRIGSETDRIGSETDRSGGGTPLNPLPAEEFSPASTLINSSTTYYNSLSVAHLPPAQERERGEARLEEVTQEPIDTHIDNQNRQTEIKATNLNSGKGNFSAAAAVAQNFRFKQGVTENKTVDAIDTPIDPQPKINTQSIGPSNTQISDSDLLSFIESKAPSDIRSKRGWARKCLETDRQYWEKTLLDDRDQRENNAHLTGIPIDSKYGCQNHTAYQLFQNEQPPVSTVKTLGYARAMLQAKWSLPTSRQAAIDRAESLGFLVSDRGIFLPPFVDPEFPLAEWEPSFFKSCE